jgi:hypothetical protein
VTYTPGARQRQLDKRLYTSRYYISTSHEMRLHMPKHTKHELRWNKCQVPVSFPLSSSYRQSTEVDDDLVTEVVMGVQALYRASWGTNEESRGKGR